MKKALIALAALAALSIVALLPLTSGAIGLCDPQHSALCSGLVEVWSFDGAATDGDRRGSYRDTYLLEPSGVDVGYSASGKLSNAAVFTGSNKLVIPRFGALTGYTTIAAWVYQTTQAGDQYIAHMFNSVAGGSPSGVVFYLAAGKPCVSVIEADTDAQTVYYTASAISANAWHLVVWKLSPFGPYGKAQACLSVDNGAFTCSSNFAFTLRGNSNDLEVGSGYIGRIDGLLIASRTWSPADVALYWNSGNGIAFPF